MNKEDVFSKKDENKEEGIQDVEEEIKKLRAILYGKK